MNKTLSKNLIFILSIGFLFFVTDFVFKNFALNNFSTVSKKIAPGLSLSFTPNINMAFSIPMGQIGIIILSIIALFALIQYFTHCVKDGLYANIWALNFIIWGAFSNFYDRILRGFVVDFIKIGSWPIFNLADVAILIGFVSLILLIHKQDKERDYHLIEAS